MAVTLEENRRRATGTVSAGFSPVAGVCFRKQEDPPKTSATAGTANQYQGLIVVQG
jgi:hypothetical protein